MESNLNTLENKVLEAIKLIKELRTENNRLKSGTEELEMRVLELEELNSKRGRKSKPESAGCLISLKLWDNRFIRSKNACMMRKVVHAGTNECDS